MAATENPFKSLRNTIASSARVYAAKKNDAWLFGIIVGWTDKDMENLREMYQWSDETCARLKRLHERYLKAAQLSTADNHKLTFVELAQRAGKPVWIKPIRTWGIIFDHGGRYRLAVDYGWEWLDDIYQRYDGELYDHEIPEEVTP